MIKFTVQRPNVRAEQIKQNVAQLAWGKDALLKEYGMEIDTNMIKVCSQYIFLHLKRNILTSG